MYAKCDLPTIQQFSHKWLKKNIFASHQTHPHALHPHSHTIFMSLCVCSLFRTPRLSFSITFIAFTSLTKRFVQLHWGHSRDNRKLEIDGGFRSLTIFLQYATRRQTRWKTRFGFRLPSSVTTKFWRFYNYKNREFQKLLTSMHPKAWAFVPMFSASNVPNSLTYLKHTQSRNDQIKMSSGYILYICM